MVLKNYKPIIHKKKSRRTAEKKHLMPNGFNLKENWEIDELNLSDLKHNFIEP